MKVKSLSRVPLFAIPWIVAHQVPLSMGFPKQECWSGLPIPSPGDFSNPGIEPGSLALGIEALSCEPPGNHIPLGNSKLKKKKQKQAATMTCLSEWPAFKGLTTPNAGKDVNQQELSFLGDGDGKL